MIINNKSHIILSLLYHFRCLTINQIFEYVFKSQQLSMKTCVNALAKLQGENNLIVKNGYFRNKSYFEITSKGINYLRKNGLYSFHKDNWDNVYYDNLLPAREVKLCDSNIKHQLALNSFVIDFILKYSDDVVDYFDEKFISSIISNIRPDGLIKTKDTLYFLEMDMNTERKARLLKKWESYRTFVHSGSFYKSMTYNIKVLFILDGISKRSTRKHTLRTYIETNLKGEISDSFNLYIGTAEELFNSMDKFNEQNPLPALFFEKGFGTSKGYFPNTPLEDYVFDNYIYKMGENNTLISENGTTMDFVVDDYRDENMYVYKKLCMFPKLSSAFNSINNRRLKYIIVVNSVLDAYNLLKDTNGYYDGVYFTTIERLKEYTFNSSLFRIENNNILYHFNDSDIRIKEEEQYINVFL